MKRSIKRVARPSSSWICPAQWPATANTTTRKRPPTARYGKYYHAKKTALALQSLVRSRYSEDSLKVIGFYTYASPLTERQLLHSAPKPVSIYDSRVFMRVKPDQPPEFGPEHFTNIQAGLKFAREHLRKQAAVNK